MYSLKGWGRLPQRENVTQAWQNEEHSHEGKELEAEDPTETKTGMGKEHDLSKGLSDANHLSGFEGTKPQRTWNTVLTGRWGGDERFSLEERLDKM